MKGHFILTVIPDLLGLRAGAGICGCPFFLGWVVPLVPIHNPYLDSKQGGRLLPLLICDCNPHTKDLTTLALPKRRLGSSLLATHACSLQELTEGTGLCARPHPTHLFSLKSPTWIPTGTGRPLFAYLRPRPSDQDTHLHETP